MCQLDCAQIGFAFWDLMQIWQNVNSFPFQCWTHECLLCYPLAFSENTGRGETCFLMRRGRYQLLSQPRALSPGGGNLERQWLWAAVAPLSLCSGLWESGALPQSCVTSPVTAVVSSVPLFTFSAAWTSLSILADPAQQPSPGSFSAGPWAPFSSRSI